MFKDWLEFRPNLRPEEVLQVSDGWLEFRPNLRPLTWSSRARISADGHLYTCLFASQGLDLLTPMREGATDQELLELIESCWSSREDRYSEIRTEVSSLHSRVEMSFIGG